MSSDTPFTPPRKKHNVMWWVAAFFAILVVLFIVQLFGPSPRIVVSPQTTHITQPLGADGLPDYERYILDLSREGVTPENNAFALLWPALFPGEVDQAFLAAVTAELGLDEIPSKDDALVSLHSTTNRALIAALLQQRAQSAAADESTTLESASADPYWNEANSPAVDQVFDLAMKRPWTSELLPPLAEWATANETPLDQLVAASRRPRYYAPSPTFLNKDRDLLIEMLLPHVQSVREAARSLSARAMWHLGEGRSEQAWQDLIALHRISSLLTQGNTLIEQLVAISMSETACQGTLTVLHQGELTPEQLRQVHRDLAALPNFSVMARSLDQTERLAALDAFISVGSGGGSEMFSALTGENGGTGHDVFDIVAVDWNLVLRETNRWYDRLVAAARLPDWPARTAALAKIDAEIQQLHAESRAPERLAVSIVSRQQRSKLVSGIMLSLFLPAVSAATTAEDRANTMLELTRLAAALAVYRAEHGEYPEKIEELVPGVLESLPVDLYNAKPFVYQRHAEGFLLYSPGENGVDDGGSNSQLHTLKGQPFDELDAAKRDEVAPVPAGADDLSIRTGSRGFEWPRMPVPAE